MQIVIEKSTKLALYMLPDSYKIAIDSRGLYGTYRAIDVLPDTHSIIKGVIEPDCFVKNALKYDDGWVIIDQSAYDAAVAANQIKFATDRMKACESALENLMDTTAQRRTWIDCLSARTAAGAPSSFQAEGIAFVNWWGACWELAHVILDEVQAGTRPIPTVEEFLAEMPALELTE